MKLADAQHRNKIIVNARGLLPKKVTRIGERAILVEIDDIVRGAARDLHGVFYEPQATLQRIAEALGRPAPDRIDDDEAQP